ncbi:caspase family protein [Nostoc sp.]|uniref:caspase family protein n=1 Tax=Nostoc sp. TaxID=1180 RepID=UPI002FFD274A
MNGYALLIGVGADLPVTVLDATAIKDVLIDPSHAAYPPEQVTLLTETSATRQNILAAFDQIIAQVNQNPDATVIIYYSGHGGRIQRTNEYFLVPFSYEPSQRADTAISGVEFTQKIEAITARKLVVLLDCCHAGGVPALKEPGETFVKSPLPPELLNVLGTGSGRVVVASWREDEYSYTGQPYSAFTDCLLSALQGKAAVNKDGYARILDILVYLFDQVPKRASGPQHPFVNKVLDLGDNFPLCYYTGGSKFLSGEAATIETSPISTSLQQNSSI